MRIIKDGVIPQEYLEEVLFTCRRCKCEFSLEYMNCFKQSYYHGTSGMFSPVWVNYETCKCPQCKFDCTNYADREKEVLSKNVTKKHV